MSNTHEANVVRVGPILPHPNADKLELTMVGGFQVVIGKGSFKEGDLAVYIQPDSVVPQTEPFRFIWGEYAPMTEPGVFDGAVPEKRRRITVKRLRKEYSEGLLMPVLEVLPEGWGHDYSVGDDVSSVLGITHYVPEEDPESTKADRAAIPRKKYPKTVRGWFFWTLRKLGLKNAGGQSYAREVSFNAPIYDINALKNARRDTFLEGEQVTVTEKIHGSNARYVFIPDDKKLNPLNPSGKFYMGSHEQWKLDGPHVWGNVARHFSEIEEWCTQNPNKVLYGEVGPTQKGFRYGAEDGEVFWFAFDVFDSTTGEWYWPGNVGVVNTVPILYAGPYDVEKIKTLVDGPSVVPGAKTIREGVVISSTERRLKLKVVSNAYFEQEGKR